MADAVGFEAHHAQAGVGAQVLGHMGEIVVRAKQHPQAVQAAQVRQVAQAVAAEVEHLQRVGQGEHLVGQFTQAAGQVESGDAGQLASAQAVQGVDGHGGGVSGADPGGDQPGAG